MSDFKYAEKNLERVMNLLDDCLNKEDIVKHWQREFKEERLSIILDRKSKEYMQK